VLAVEGFARLPRRRDEQRRARICRTIEAVADAREFFACPARVLQRALGGLFLFISNLIRFNPEALADRAKLPGSRILPAVQALLTSFALKLLWSIERKEPHHGPRLSGYAESRV
jgi:hypothetical protein